MNEYNEKWTREKFVEYRKLKKGGYTHDMLKEHFGDDIWYSGLYNKNSCTLPHIIKYAHFVNEIKVNPEETDYNYMKMPSVFFKNETDYIISFYSNDLPYIIALMYFPINDIETYNIVFTTSVQWNEYNFKLKTFNRKGHITDEEYEILNKIISKETKLNDLYSILKKISWILLDFYTTNLVDKKLSIGDTENEKKIKLYRRKMKANIKIEKEVEILSVEAGVRYWEDATVNGEEDVNGDLIPCRIGDLWCPEIDIDNGIILNWTQGTTAKIHYKVCDCGSYYLKDEDYNVVMSIEEDYVPSIMCPKERGFGDYIIMDVDENGKIQNWKIKIEDFEKMMIK